MIVLQTNSVTITVHFVKILLSIKGLDLLTVDLGIYTTLVSSIAIKFSNMYLLGTL